MYLNRWNSTYYLIERYLELSDEIKEIDDKLYKSHSLNDEDISILIESMEMFMTIATITKVIYIIILSNLSIYILYIL